MKSIKEKAEEHAPYTREDSWSKTQKCIIAQTSFEAGANYVLEQFEEFLNLYGVYCITLNAKIYLKDMIEQLKGNQ